MKQQIINKHAFVVGLIFCVLLASLSGGCAARSAMMILTSFEITNKIPTSVRVEDAVGGRETNPLWTSQISSTAYTDALANSLTRSGLFETVYRQGQGSPDYILNITILGYDQPVIGLDLDVKMKTKWELTDAKKLTPVWSDTFETTYRAKVGDALIAAERLQKANEGSARTNIAEGIKRLSQAKI